MSTICGVIHLNNSPVDQTTQVNMREALNELSLDRVNTLSEKNVFLCCGIQYVTRQSKQEDGIKHDKEAGIYYVADCIIDNRDELIQLLDRKESLISDSDLLYYAYEKWESQIGDYVCGIFAFVLYDSNKQKVVLYTDHTGSRCLYVRKKDQTVFFSTTYAPLLAAEPSGKIATEKRFITGCLATLSPDMYIIPGLTPYEGVHQILAGHYIQIEKDTYEQFSYWTPFQKRKDYQKLTGQKAKDSFLKLFTQCVNEVLQSEKKTGITLSSGLDSSSVACLAARRLQESNQQLYSFTSIPMDGYVNKEDRYYIVDESFGPKEIQKQYTNLVPTFLPCNGKDAFTDMEQVVHNMEFPYKSGQAMVWLEEAYQSAQNMGVTVMLKGQYGNCTISYGAILTLVNQKCHHLHFLSAYHEFRSFMRRKHIRKKTAIHGCLTAIHEKLSRDTTTTQHSLVKESLLKESKVIKQVQHIVRSCGGTIMDSKRQRREFLYYLQGLSQLGAYDTKLGLLHKIIIRDPTKDKRMLEFCANVPMDCFVHDGIERAMIRDYMKDIIPEKLLVDSSQRGLQCADFSQRIEKNWSNIYEQIIPMFCDQNILYYCDPKKLNELKNSITKKAIPQSQEVLIQVMHLYSTYIFLKQHE